MAISNKIVSTYPSAIVDSELEHGKAADAEIPQILAGRARWLYEHATGGVNGLTPKVTMNPQGFAGHDHSGPPYGTAFLHPVTAICGNTTTPSTVQFTRLPNQYAISSTNPLEWEAMLWVRPHARGIGVPYSRLQLSMRIKASASATLTITYGSIAQSNFSFTQAITTSETTYHFTSANRQLRCVPGFNRIYLRLSMTAESATLAGFAWSQVKPRSW